MSEIKATTEKDADKDLARYPYVHVDVTPDDSELVSWELWELAATGVEERTATTMNHASSDAEITLVASFSNFEDANAALASMSERFPARIEVIEGDGWRDNWKAYFKPSRLGRLVIRPTWETVTTEPHEVVLTIDPGCAFGSGIHETTRLCLSEIERSIKGDERVLDVGCGSGILSVGAMLFGAKSARAIDIDEISIDVTRENAELNGVQVSASMDGIDDIEGTFDVVYANIQAHILIPMVKPLVGTVEKKGTLILSGVLNDQSENVTEVFEGAGMAFERIEREGEWCAIIFKWPE